MLQITVKLFKDGTRYVSHIAEDGKILSVFNKQEKKIDLSVLLGHEGEKFDMKFCKQGDSENEFTHVNSETCMLRSVDNEGGIWKFSYDTADNKSKQIGEEKQ